MSGQPSPWLWLIPATPTSIPNPPAMPNPMIVVRRKRLKRLPQKTRPARNTSSPTPAPSETVIGSTPPARTWVGKRGTRERSTS